ncbi:flagellar basal-body rod protein FlgF [Halodesulfovibrio sp.]|uniref:flagellar basal-body rod protein FlgF n=1 Tax=Halodesulfovibrio sp. TaxID=1912772 RepID=UPI0025F417F9|nr:flagellar basal-body rod protein FlgF [Halodesulfovibrio sp.]MCT4534720.1 flagellar basal-body rod protein FlgF [Halodesulfovibrio sp.]MCT4628052.1 flagellar basal-body rod protein FlgF [Halodesulfovibrio sp.]
MQSSVYSALFGALTNEHRLNNISNNLANINTTGYKRDQLAFKDTFVMFAHDQIMEPVANVRSEKLFPDPKLMAKPRIALAQTDFTPGAVKVTGGPLDMAIHGEGFFKIQTPDGEYLTRNGKFRQSADGTLVTDRGYPVMGDGGPVELPRNAHIVVGSKGEIYANNAQVAQLQVVTFDDMRGLEKHGQNMFRVREGADVAEQPAALATVQQGALESANVEVVSEMVNMIEAHRQFEAYTKIMKTSGELDKNSTQRLGKASA